MARSIYSPSPSPGLLSPSFSDSSEDEAVPYENADAGPSRPATPATTDAGDVAETDSVTCQWEDCRIVFTHLPTLIEHIHNDHIGVHKSNYTCEWSTCIRRGLAQTSRFALISHIRSHTGEKPFTCPRPGEVIPILDDFLLVRAIFRPECDKSFTRSDALAKHMRLQHNIPAPLPGRGGNRKRKREEPEAEPQAAAPPSTSAFNTFKVEPHTPSELFDDNISISHGEQRGDYFTNGGGPRRSASPGSVDTDGWDDGEDGLPLHLIQSMDPHTGMIMGRSPDMVKYIILKAKHNYALEQHEQLIEELRVARYELKKERELKDAVLDNVFRASFGYVFRLGRDKDANDDPGCSHHAQADMLITPVSIGSRHLTQHRSTGEPIQP